MKMKNLSLVYDTILGSSLDFYLSNSLLLPYRIKNVDGLEPMIQEQSFSSLPEEGQLLQSSRPSAREVIITLKVLPNYAIGEDPSSIRSDIYAKLYSANLPSMILQVKGVHNGADATWNAECTLKGVIPNPFSKDPELVITLSCLSSYFEQPTTVKVDTSNATNFTGLGTAPSPYEMLIRIPSDYSSVLVLNRSRDDMRFTYPFKKGNLLKFSTDRRNRYVTWYNSETDYSGGGSNSFDIFGSMVNPKWGVIYPGSNTIRASLGASQIPGANYEISYKPRFLGI